MNANILEHKDVQFFKFETLSTSNSQNEFRLSGLAFHSALCVSDIIQKKHQNEIQIVIYLVKCKKGFSGRFDYCFTVSQDIETITFGNIRTVIWSKGM